MSAEYTQEEVWEAICYFIPSFRIVRENKLNLNMTTALNAASKRIAIELYENGFQIKSIEQKRMASIVLKHAIDADNIELSFKYD